MFMVQSLLCIPFTFTSGKWLLTFLHIENSSQLVEKYN
jgi:hypothetical protein